MEPLYLIAITLPEPLWKRKSAHNGERSDPENREGAAVCAGASGHPGRTGFWTRAYRQTIGFYIEVNWLEVMGFSPQVIADNDKLTLGRVPGCSLHTLYLPNLTPRNLAVVHLSETFELITHHL